jgi:hypothetical protein
VQPKARDDALNQLSVAVPADEDIGGGAAVGKRHHQLLRVPECDDHSFALRKQCIHVLRPFDPHPDRAAQQPYDSIPERGHTGKLDSGEKRFQHATQNLLIC